MEVEYSLNNNSKLEVQNVILKYNGTDYALDDVDTIDFTNGKTKDLRRGLGSKSNYGISISNNRNTPKNYTINTGNISTALFAILKENFEDEVPDRFTLFFYDKKKGTSRAIKNCLLAEDPEQASYGETYYQTKIVLKTFDNN